MPARLLGQLFLLPTGNVETMVADKEKQKFIAPYALFTGALLSFAAACAAGFIVRDRNFHAEFGRWHQFIGSETLYYPTASEVRAIARSRLTADKIAVVVGGNSVLYGSGQRAEEVWTQ